MRDWLHQTLANLPREQDGKKIVYAVSAIVAAFKKDHPNSGYDSRIRQVLSDFVDEGLVKEFYFATKGYYNSAYEILIKQPPSEQVHRSYRTRGSRGH